MDIHQIFNVFQSFKQDETHDSKNIFSILGISKKETLHSRLLSFLLIDSLNTDKLFWNNLVRKIAQGEKLFESLIDTSIDNIYINTEHSFDNDRYSAESKNFIDIFISNKVCAIAIENKIEASEGKDQIIRYQKYLTSRKEEGKAIVYLTRNKDFPSGYNLNASKLVCISWSDILNCLDNSLNNKEPLNLFTPIKNHLYNSFVKNNEDFEKCYDLFTQDYYSYKKLADNFEKCIKKQTLEWFDFLQRNINETFNNQFVTRFMEDDSIGKGKFTLTIQKAEWICYNISIKIYRHGALGAFPCIETIKNDNKFAIPQNHTLYTFINPVPFNLGKDIVFYFSYVYFQDNIIENQKKRWINRNPISLSIYDFEKALEKITEYSKEIDIILTKYHV